MDDQAKPSVCSTEKRIALQKMRLKTGMVFQSFNLFPHLTALQNVTARADSGEEDAFT